MKLTAELNKAKAGTLGQKRKHKMSNENGPITMNNPKQEDSLGPSPKKKKRKNLHNSDNAETPFSNRNTVIEPEINTELNKKRKKNKQKSLPSQSETINDSQHQSEIENKKTISPIRKKKNRKKKVDIDNNSVKDETNIETSVLPIRSDNGQDINDRDSGDHIAAVANHGDQNEATKKEENSIPISESNSPRKKKRKKNKANLVSTDGGQQNESSENNSSLGEKSIVSKPLKSSLKKKKNKKKKKLSQTKQQRDTNDPTDNVKKLTWKKSVTFDENVQVELIDSCLSKSPDEKTQINNERKKEKALAYLKRWKHDKANWKFEKLTQMWLLKQMYHENMVPTDVFSDLLEYLVNLKGASKELVSKLSQQIITKMEQKNPDEKDDELDVAYSRARLILQHLQ